MSQVIVDHHTRAEIIQIQQPPTTLFDTLYNSLILRHTLPYLPVSGLLNLAATCRDIRHLLHETPGVFRHLDLTRVRTAHCQDAQKESERNLAVWHNVNLADYLTEDDRRIASTAANVSQQLLRRSLEGHILYPTTTRYPLSCPIPNPRRVRMLSIRGVQNLNHGKLRSALAYACRSSRPENTPRLKALYVFGELSPVNDARDEDAWWSRKGRMLESTGDMDDWAQCLVACQGIISFDAVLCQGPRHANSPVFGKTYVPSPSNPAIATFAVGGCASCGKAPEGAMTAQTHCSSLPLLAPPPILASSVQAATTPRPGQDDKFVPRCAGCLNDRFCVTCNKWWCEECYQPFGRGCTASPAVAVKKHVSRSCWECGMNCNECIERTQKVCKKCCGGYCLVHNEGSSSSFCDWCFSSGRGLRRV
ncbi:hypothetical protein FLONG3_2068 [Fusarium longipes]|uniref:F-box domain-containing protein n=1 Tax=Fusarium longipes TaxID=694270 RepID=A0A395T6C5_9HYPO|nr:hypothetical protein FLONG3_2068 [Fusarium longipes]